MKFKHFLIFVLLLLINGKIISQTLTNNPYSYFGLGFIENNGFSESSATGLAGIAMPSAGNLNSLNPASYSAIDSSSFYFYLGFYGKQSTFKSEGLEQKVFDSNIKYLSIGFRVSRRWGSSIGLVPFSSRGYYVTSNYPTEGDLSEYQLQSTGSGSISRFYFGNSYRITKHLSLGANISYLFGMLKNLEQISYNDANFSNVSSVTSNYFRNFYFDFGLQYNFKKAKNSYYSGIIYTPLQKLNTTYDKLVLNSSDTLYYKAKGKSEFQMPGSLGVGLGIDIDEKLKLMLDYKTTQWSESNYSSSNVKLRDSWQINAGANYIHDNKTGRKYWDYVNYRAGLRFEKSYLSIKGKDLNLLAFTAGLGLPIYNRTMINISYEFGNLGTDASGAINETYHKITIGFAFKDKWFQKKKFY
jgi:hypothetical protein